MKKHSILLASIFFIALAVASGCKTVTEVQPASTGSIIGWVGLFEMDGSKSASSAGVDVNILGTNRHAITDSAGNYIFDNLPAGYYSMRFTKAGFSSSVSGPQEFVGADTLPNGPEAFLYRINNWKVTLGHVTDTEALNPDYSLDTTFFVVAPKNTSAYTVLDSAGKPVSMYYTSGGPVVALFVGRTPNIDYRDSTSYFSWTQTTSGYGTVTYFQSPHPRPDTVYMIAYPISGSSAKFIYFSGGTYKSEFTGFGPASNVVKFVLP